MTKLNINNDCIGMPVNSYPYGVFGFANKKSYCRSGFPPHVNHEWSVVRDDWDDLVDDFFRRILIETLKYCKRKRSKFCGT